MNPTYPKLSNKEIEHLTFETIRQITLRANSNSLITRKCEAKRCNAILTYEQNFRNCYCWNCLVKLARYKGHDQVANVIIRDFL